MAKKDRSFVVFQCPETEKYLILKKSKKKGKWCFVGGKVNKNEHPMCALVREVWEEVGFQICNVGLGTVIQDINHQIFVYRSRLYTSAHIKLSKEHVRYKWCTIRQLKMLKLNRPARLIAENAL